MGSGLNTLQNAPSLGSLNAHPSLANLQAALQSAQAQNLLVANT